MQPPPAPLVDLPARSIGAKWRSWTSFCGRGCGSTAPSTGGSSTGCSAQSSDRGVLPDDQRGRQMVIFSKCFFGESDFGLLCR